MRFCLLSWKQAYKARIYLSSVSPSSISPFFLSVHVSVYPFLPVFDRGGGDTVRLRKRRQVSCYSRSFSTDAFSKVSLVEPGIYGFRTQGFLKMVTWGIGSSRVYDRRDFLQELFMMNQFKTIHSAVEDAGEVVEQPTEGSPHESSSGTPSDNILCKHRTKLKPRPGFTESPEWAFFG